MQEFAKDLASYQREMHRQHAVISDALSGEQLDDWAEDMQVRLRTACRHFSQALIKSNGKGWLTLMKAYSSLGESGSLGRSGSLSASGP